MSFQANRFTLFLLIICLAFGQGCDRVSELFDYFSGKRQPAQAPAAPVSPARPEKADSAPAPTTPVAKAPVSAAKKKEPPANVLAQVGDWTLTKAEFEERLAALQTVIPEYDTSDRQANRLILDELIHQQLLVQDAERQGLAQNKDVQQAVEEFRRTLLVREMAAKIAEKATVTEQEAEEYYQQNVGDFTAPSQWRLREIVVAEEQQAKDILVELYKDETDFAVVAEDKSISDTAVSGGAMGYVSTFDFPKMQSAVQTLDVGDVSSIFKGPQGFYIVKLEDKIGGEQREFGDVKEEIMTGLTLLKQQQEILIYLGQLREQTKIHINEKLLEE